MNSVLDTAILLQRSAQPDRPWESLNDNERNAWVRLAGDSLERERMPEPVRWEPMQGCEGSLS